MNKNNSSIMSNNEKLLPLYFEVTNNARFVVDKIWASAKFFTTISSALLTAAIATLYTIFRDNQLNTLNYVVGILLTFLPIMVIIISSIGIKNLTREYKKFLDWVIVLDKLEEKLGLYEETQFNNYPGDKYLLPERFIKSSFNSSKEFIVLSLQKKGTLRYYFKILHSTYIVLALFIILTLIGYLLQIFQK
jgi:hypothetical protein